MATLHLRLKPELMAQVEEYRWRHRLETRTDAVEALLNAGLGREPVDDETVPVLDVSRVKTPEEARQAVAEFCDALPKLPPGVTRGMPKRATTEPKSSEPEPSPLRAVLDKLPTMGSR